MPLTITERTIKEDPFFQEGLKRGKLEAKREDVINLHRELHLPPEKIAKVLKVSEEFVREVLIASTK